MKVALVTESFPPQVNGVARSVARTAEHLHARGHHPIVIAPAPGRGPAPDFPWPVVHVPSLPVPAYRDFRAGLSTGRLEAALGHYRPDLIHLASPFGYTARAAEYASRAGIASVAVWQTDLPAYTRAYHLNAFEALVWKRLRRIHSHATVNLALSQCTARTLAAQGIGAVEVLGHGVDTRRFHPRHRSPDLHRMLAPAGEVLVGYVGRLAREKHLHLLTAVSELPGVRVVIAGDGPRRRHLTRLLPRATFLGPLHGGELSALYATLDLFIHTGPYETFGQTIQEAHASAVPVLTIDAGGAAELVTPGVDGDRFAPDDAPALAATVAALTHERDLLRRWGSEGRTRVEGRTWEAVGDTLIDHYERALAQQSRSPRHAAGAPAIPTV